MFRFPRYFIFLFVGLSIATAFGIHLTFNYQPVKRSDLSSTDGFAVRAPSQESDSESASAGAMDRAVEQVVNLTAEANQRVQEMTSAITLPEEADKCKCTIGIQNHKHFEFEDPKSCGSERLMYEKVFQQYPRNFRIERPQSSGDFPRACLTYIMNKYPQGTKRSSMAATCAGPRSPVVVGGYKPCITETYVNTIYNYFTDVTSCLDLPQREYLPKVFNESGFLLNALGSKLDSGMGQIMPITIRDGNRSFSEFKARVLNSSKESCVRLADQVRKLTPLSGKYACETIAASQNPLASLMYMAIKHYRDKEYIRGRLEKTFVIERMKKLGFDRPEFEEEQLYKILITVGYNSGAETAAIYLHSYLRQVERQKRKLTFKDFDFGFKEPKRGTAEWKQWYNTFPAYVARVQRGGQPRYGYALKDKAKDLNSVFKEGVCVPASYLAL